jgi:uncharacterized repeat protein (TIGR02543 family)
MIYGGKVMKNKIVVAVISALICMGFVTACNGTNGNGYDDNMVTVKFNTDGGNIIPDVKIPKGSNLMDEGKVPGEPEKAGYDFAGWYDSKDIDQENPWWMLTPINSNMTLKASWWPQDPFRGPIWFNPMNGQDIFNRNPSNVGDPIPNFPADPVRIGFIFQGWFHNDIKYDENTLVTEVRITLIAKWELDPNVTWVNVQFNTDGGFPAVIPPVSIPQGASLNDEFPANPIKGNFTFGGWFHNDFRYHRNTPINEDITLTARWVTYGHQSDGTWIFDHSLFSSYYGATIQNGDTIVFGTVGGNGMRYFFPGGLNLADYSALVIFFTLIPANHETTGLPLAPPFGIAVAGDGPDVTQSWGQDVRYITFNAAGNTVLVISGAEYTTLRNIREVDSILLKYNERIGGNFSMKISSMMLVQALPQVTAIIDPDNGSPITTRTVTAGAAIGALPTNLTKPGHSFVRWFNPASGSTINAQTIIGNITVRAEWVERVNVTFMSQGNIHAFVTVDKGSTIGNQFPGNPVNSEGLLFLGWYAESDTEFEHLFTRNTPIMETVTLVPKWASAEDIVTVTFNSNGGGAVSPITLLKGETMGAQLTTPARPVVDLVAYVFLGWFDENDTEYTRDTVIESDVTLTAKWREIQPHIVNANADDTLFSAVGNWVDTSTKLEKFSHDDKLWWVLGDTRTATGWNNVVAGFDSDVLAALQAHHANGFSRLAYDFPAAANVYSNYSTITVEYEIIHVCGSRFVQIRRTPDGSSGDINGFYNGYFQLETGADRSFSRPIIAFNTAGGLTGDPSNVISLVKSGTGDGTGAMLVRFTRIIFHN